VNEFFNLQTFVANEIVLFLFL